MFDVGFTELLVIGIVALLVVGPEKLPSVIRTGIQYFRQFKSGVSNIRDEVERELALDEIKKDIDGSKADLTKAIGYDELHESLGELKKEANSLHDVSDWKEDHDDISDEEIEADLFELNDEMGPQLPDANEQADTGIEEASKTRKTAKKQLEKPKDKKNKSDKSDKKPKKKKSKKLAKKASE